MKKTAVFTSVIMLLSVVHSGFAAESASASAEREQRVRDEYEKTLTPGQTFFQLEHLIMPGYDRFERKSIVNDSSTRNAARVGGFTGGAAVYTTAIVNPYVGLAAMGAALWDTATTGGRYDRHNGYSKRPCKTPVLSVLIVEEDHTQPSVLKVEEEKRERQRTLFYMDSFEELSEAPDGYNSQAYLSKGGDKVEGVLSNDWHTERKVHNKIRVSIEPSDSVPPSPQIKIWKCHGLCNTEGKSERPPETCATLIQPSCPSPDGLTLASFAPSICAQYLAFGFTNGAVGILHRNYTPRSGLGEEWTWYQAFEERVGKSLSQYIQDHIERLQGAWSPSPREIAEIQKQLAILPPSL
jgi:hypothetical protein